MGILLSETAARKTRQLYFTFFSGAFQWGKGKRTIKGLELQKTYGKRAEEKGETGEFS